MLLFQFADSAGLLPSKLFLRTNAFSAMKANI